MNAFAQELTKPLSPDYLDWRTHLIICLFGIFAAIVGIIRRRHLPEYRQHTAVDHLGDIGLGLIATELTFIIGNFRHWDVWLAIFFAVNAGHFSNRKIWARLDRVLDIELKALIRRVFNIDERKDESK